MQGRRFKDLDEMVTAYEGVSPNDAAGWYCTEVDQENDELNLFFWPPESKRRHGLCVIPLTGLTGWTYTDDENGLTVSPSIFLNPNGNPPGWHGFLERGIWRTV